MTDSALKKRIHDSLKIGYFESPDDLVDVSDGPADDIHVVVVSRKFDGRRWKDRDDLLWSELSRSLGEDELGQISLLIAASPEEVKTVAP